MGPHRSLIGWRGYAVAAAAVATMVLLLLAARPYIGVQLAPILFIPLIALVGRLIGFRASVVASLLSFGALLYFFVPPYDAAAVASVRDWATLVVFLLVALITGAQTGLMRRSAQSALMRERSLALINRLGAALLAEESLQRAASTVAGQVVASVRARSAMVWTRDADGVPVLAGSAGTPPGAESEALAVWVMRNDKAVGLPHLSEIPADERPISVEHAEAGGMADPNSVYLPLQSGLGIEGVLAALPRQGGFDADEVRLLIAMGTLAASFFERQRLQDGAARADALRETDRLKSNLVSSVSHEFKTPLSAVTARVTGLLEEGADADAARVREELEAMEEDLGRLNASIGDLLDLSRLETDSWRPTPESYEVSEILGTVLSRLRARQRSRVAFRLADDLPAVHVDFAQLVRALLNIVENALTYSPPGSPVEVGARQVGDDVQVWVRDEGPGVPIEERASVFDKFFRGSAASSVPSGTGLGLAITREIVRNHGGRLWVEDAPPTGARFVVSLPVGGPHE
jgi:two-component system, OmpR family, sensor histidine kinase KdpD